MDSQKFTTRRDAFAAFGATGLAGIALAGFARPEAIAAPKPAPAGSDSELLRLVEELIQTDIAYFQTNLPWSDLVEPAPDWVEEALSALATHGWALRRKIAETPSRGALGMAAKARVTKDQLLAWGDPVGLDPNEAIILSLCCDIEAASAGASA